MSGKKIGTTLHPLVQLLPAAVLAAVLLVTLPGTVPVLAEVPQRLEMAAVEETPAPVEEIAEEEEPLLPYADGVYTGSSRGYGGTVQVQVTMEGGHITDVQILRAKQETSSFLRRAKRLLKTVLQEQTWEVDAVSEATYTSSGILGAIRNALTGEVVNNPLPPQPKPAEPLVEEVFEEPSAYLDGVYTATAEGFGGPIPVQVTITGDTITDITIVSHEGETTSYFAKARSVVSAILESGTPAGVDAVSGATYSSTGILNAVKQALAKAANPEGTASQPEETETPADGEEAAASEPQVMEPVVEVVQPEEKQPTAREWVTELWQSIFAQEGSCRGTGVLGGRAGRTCRPAGEHYGGTGGSRRMKRYRNFILRAVNLLLVAVLLVQYQHIAVARAATVAQREQQIAEVESWNASVLQAEKAEEEQQAEEEGYKDGVYEGTGLGFGDDITVSVTIQDGQMTDITVVSADGEDKPYYRQAIAVLDEILTTQSAEGDAVAGATLTAEGLIEAVADALGKAAA